MKVILGFVLTMLVASVAGVTEAGVPESGIQQSSACVRKLEIPGYPQMARQARIQGDVSAIVHLDKEGNVASISEVKGSPFLVQTAEALRRWEFALKESKATDIRITLRFRLEGPEQRENMVMRVSAELPNLIEIVTNPTEKPGPDVLPSHPK